MSTGYGWEGIRQVSATLLGARHVSERLCGGACLQRGAITSVRAFLPLTARQSIVLPYTLQVHFKMTHRSTYYAPEDADVKPCPHCRRKVRLSHKSETVLSQKSATVAVVSPFSATVSLFCDSVDRA